MLKKSNPGVLNVQRRGLFILAIDNRQYNLLTVLHYQPYQLCQLFNSSSTHQLANPQTHDLISLRINQK